jgi:hypothetical protein
MALAEADVLSEVYGLLAYVTSLDNIFRGNQSREVLPADDNFVIYTPIVKRRVGTNVKTFNAKGVPDSANGTYGDKSLVLVDIQIDCYGENANEYAQMINLFAYSIVCRDWLVSQNMGIRVCNCTDPQQVDLIDDTRQYCNRYMVTLTVCFDSNLLMGIPWFEDVTFKDIANVDVKFKP